MSSAIQSVLPFYLPIVIPRFFAKPPLVRLSILYLRFDAEISLSLSTLLENRVGVERLRGGKKRSVLKAFVLETRSRIKAS